MKLPQRIPILVIIAGVLAQDDDAASKLCEGKSSGEMFRLQAGKNNCRDVVQCTASGLQQIRCPPGLAFDLEKQTCDWKAAVTNCDKLQKEKKAKPLLVTDEPVCGPEESNKLACGDLVCINKELFCDGKKDCNDGSDENVCDQENDPNRAPECDPTICTLPDCFCSNDGTKVPGGLCPGDGPCDRVPQMVTISFDSAVNNNNIDLYAEIYNQQRKNPNGCDIKGTFYVSHQYTNYSAVGNLHRLGHEIGSNSITHNSNETFWSYAGVDDWAKEMAGSRLIIEKFGNITDNSVVGLRAPYLRVGGNYQFTMMEEQGFLYDSSITAPLQNPPLWPYTLYFRMPHKCHGNLQNCPTRPLAVWEIPINELDRREDPTVDEDLPGCAMVDSCSNIRSGDQFYNFLTHNFYRHFDQNRAPLGLFFHSSWLKNNPEFLDAFLYWIDEVLANHPEVYFVTQTQVIQWIQDPVTVEAARNFPAWQEKCSPGPRTECLVPNACKLANDKELPGQQLVMYTCTRCPNQYPWKNDPYGEGILN